MATNAPMPAMDPTDPFPVFALPPIVLDGAAVPLAADPLLSEDPPFAAAVIVGLAPEPLSLSAIVLVGPAFEPPPVALAAVMTILMPEIGLYVKTEALGAVNSPERSEYEAVPVEDGGAERIDPQLENWGS